MLLRATALVALVLATTAPAAYAQTFDGCFARTYDKAHLAAHSGQTVTAIKMKLEPRNMGDGNNVSVQLSFDFRNKKGEYYAVGTCREEAGALTCGLDQDAGKITLKPGKDGLLLSPVQDLRADNVAGDESDLVMIETANPEHRSFALPSVPATDCREFDDSGED